jgi:hypothetical protein
MHKPINTLPIETFIEKSRIAARSNQKFMNMDIKEVQALSDSLAMVMTRLVAIMDAEKQIRSSPLVSTSVNVDGGNFST